MLANLSKKIKVPNWLFAVTVVVPLILSIIYYGFLASDIYISESRFVIKSPDKPASSGLGVILKSAGFATASDEVFAVQSFVTSRDALRTVNQNDAFKRAYSQPSISVIDRFDPSGLFGSFEHLYNYYQGKVTLNRDAITSISTLTVRAYDPKTAHRRKRPTVLTSNCSKCPKRWSIGSTIAVGTISSATPGPKSFVRRPTP
jgi:capsular polysaccharide transport system permease protein